MPEQESFPPPGEPATPPPGAGAPAPPGSDVGGATPAWAPSGPAGPTAGTAGGTVAHRPGAVPLRPLRLGDMIDGAFRILRYNPGATLGAAALVSAVAMAVPVALTAALGPRVGAVLDSGGESIAAGEVGAIGAQVLSALLLQVGVVLVTGLVAHVTHTAASGRKIDLAEAWRLTRGKRWRLLGLALLLQVPFVVAFGIWAAVVVGYAATGPGLGALVTSAVTGFVVLLVVGAWYYVRCVLLAAVAFLLEPVGVLGAVVRAFRLTSRQVWRVLGISIVAGLIVGVVNVVLSLPLGLAGEGLSLLAPGQEALVRVLAQSFATVLLVTLTAPFTAAVTTLQYLDQRIRKEAYDVELLTRAGIG